MMDSEYEEADLVVHEDLPPDESDLNQAVDTMHLSTESIDGYFEPLKTKAEVETRDKFIFVYVCEIPVKRTGEIINAIKTIPGSDKPPLSHIRRVVKGNHYPEFLRRWSPPDREKLYIYLCASDVAAREEVIATLAKTPTFADRFADVLVVPVPLYPPTSSEHAIELSKKYWPIIYTASNPFGPHPHALVKATKALSINGNANMWMKRAFDIAHEGPQLHRGYPIGSAIVQRAADGKETLVCVASDARWATSCEGVGNPMGHSLMRAIAITAEKRKLLRLESPDDEKIAKTELVSYQGAMTPVERRYFSDLSTLAPNGYLCLDLYAYTTHEPCVMCAMALVHSRFSGVIFGEEMYSTGGLVFDRDRPKAEPDNSSSCAMSRVVSSDTSETDSRYWTADEGFTSDEGPEEPRSADIGPNGQDIDSKSKAFLSNLATLKKVTTTNSSGSRYGLFYRDDLNWRFLAWQYLSKRLDQGRAEEIPGNVNA